MKALRKGIQQAKRNIEGYIMTLWARDTGRLQRETIKFLWRNVFNDPKQMFTIAIGSNVDYAKWVYKMINVNWTNKRTKEIEGRFIEATITEARKELRRHITNQLSIAGYDWMFGRGKLPKQLTVYTSRGNEKAIPRYRGTQRILQWVS